MSPSHFVPSPASRSPARQRTRALAASSGPLPPPASLRHSRTALRGRAGNTPHHRVAPPRLPSSIRIAPLHTLRALHRPAPVSSLLPDASSASSASARARSHPLAPACSGSPLLGLPPATPLRDPASRASPAHSVARNRA